MLTLSGYWKTRAAIIEGNAKVEIPPAPHIKCYLRCPEKTLSGKLDFLIDTGADFTTIMPDDRQTLVIPSRYLTDGVPSMMFGVGGGTPIKYMQNITFEFKNEDAAIQTIQLERIAVLAPATQHRRLFKGVPSLLGRDILNNCAFEFTPKTVILEYEGP